MLLKEYRDFVWAKKLTSRQEDSTSGNVFNLWIEANFYF